MTTKNKSKNIMAKLIDSLKTLKESRKDIKISKGKKNKPPLIIEISKMKSKK